MSFGFREARARTSGHGERILDGSLTLLAVSGFLVDGAPAPHLFPHIYFYRFISIQSGGFCVQGMLQKDVDAVT